MAKRTDATKAAEPWRDPVLGPCACSQLRRTARAVSALYDEVLASAGLTVTQYALLVSLARASRADAGLSRTALAATLGMERTTLTRNLRPLERAGLITAARGTDRRQSLLQLTPTGRRRLARSFPLWERAQKAFFAELGQPIFEQLRALLVTAADAAKAAGGRPPRRSEPPAN